MTLLYIDPGTGSMLITIILGMVSVVYFFARKIIIRAKTLITGGRRGMEDEDHIDYLIFSDSKRYWSTFRPVCELFERDGIKASYWTCSEDDPALSESYEHVSCRYVGSVNRAASKLNFVDADIVLSTTPGLDVYQWKRSKNAKYYVHVFHALGDATFYRMFGLDYYDAVMMVAPYQRDQIRALEKAHHVPEKELFVAGLPYMDSLLERAKSLHSDNKNDGHLSILLASSWGANSILSRYGSALIMELAATGHDIIIRPHPQSYTSDREVLEGIRRDCAHLKNLTWDQSNDNFETLSRADIMISDFSGVIFDYALIFDRPVIYADTSFDPSVYDMVWVKGELWIFESLKKLGVKLLPEDVPRIGEVINEALHDEDLAKGREEVRKSGWSNIGNSAEFIERALIRKREELLSKRKAEVAE